MSKNTQRLQALRDRGEAMYREGLTDGKVAAPHRYQKLEPHFGRYNIGYKHGYARSGHRKPKPISKVSFWQKVQAWLVMPFRWF